jgi:thiamine biosynthesis lipoprotein
VLTCCSRTDTPPWRVGIEDPAERSRLLEVAVLRDGGVATSGIAARGAHIYDPFTGAPARGLASVTVTGPSLLWADVYATAAFARGPGAAEWLSGLDGWSALVVGAAGDATRIRWARAVGG